MTQLTLQEIEQLKDQLIEDLPQIRSFSETSIDHQKLESEGIELNGQNARVVGVYSGASPGFLIAGVEVQQLVLYDTVTEEYGVYLYTGVTAGVTVSVPGTDIVGGIILFDGPLSEISGTSYGAQGSAGVAVGYSRTLSGDNMIQIGGELSVAAEVTWGYTWGQTDARPVVDWDLVEISLQQTFANNPEKLAMAIADLAVAKSLGGAYQDDFVDEYEIYGVFSPEQCFPAGTMITLAGGSKKPIESIATTDIVMSFDKLGNLVPARVTQLLDNVTDTWLKLSNGTVVTPGHRFLRPDGSFMEIKDIIALDGQIVAEDGSVMSVTAEVIEYSSDTAHMFEQHEKVMYASAGGTALQPETKTGWRTYPISHSHPALIAA